MDDWSQWTVVALVQNQYFLEQDNFVWKKMPGHHIKTI